MEAKCADNCGYRRPNKIEVDHKMFEFNDRSLSRANTGKGILARDNN